MRHAVLGAGGVGGLLAAALARAGSDVRLVLREAPERSPARLSVESAVLGTFAVDVDAASGLDRDVDVLWVTVKAAQLEDALAPVPAARLAAGVVIPLLNGVDHMTVLRQRYPHVVAGAIRVESERISPGSIAQRSPFLRVDLAGAADAAAELRGAGIDCLVHDDELTLLWGKLVFLAPLALATTALDAPLGGIRDDKRFLACLEEAIAVAHAEGAVVDSAQIRAALAGAPDAMRSSMQKDVEAGAPPELDAIAGPIIRAGRRHDIPTPSSELLSRLVADRAAVPPIR